MAEIEWMNEKYDAIVDNLRYVQNKEYEDLKREVMEDLGLSEGRHDILVMNALDELEEKGVLSTEGESSGYQGTVYKLDTGFRIRTSAEEESEETISHLLTGGAQRREEFEN